MKNFLLIIGVLLGCQVLAQPLHTEEPPLRLMFYNVENLFDTIDAPDKFDEDFTPTGKLQHTGANYRQKLAHLATVIDSAFGGASPSILGLCEVENEQVVKDLRDSIRIPNHLKVLHRESPDQRGIDNALLYDSTRLALLASGGARVDLGPDERPTRDLLWAVFQVPFVDSRMAVVVGHWPSRYGGKEESEWKRMKASERTVALKDSLENAFTNLGVVVMGDLNDHPDDNSVKQLEKCDDVEVDPCMVNTHAHWVGTDTGSHAYRGEWGVLDQILIDQTLVNGNIGWTTQTDGGTFVKFPWMLYYSERDDAYFPGRTYGGTTHYGGYSDHLPAILELHLP